MSCEIYEVPLDGDAEEPESPESPIENQPVRKQRKKRTMTEEQKEICRKNLAKAREKRAQLILDEKKRKERVSKGVDRVDIKEDSETDEPKLDVRTKRGNYKRSSKRDETPPRHRSKRDEYISESDENSWSDEDEEDYRPKRGKGSKAKKAPAKSKAKKVSEKSMRLALLEDKLDDIIRHTKTMAAKPRIKRTNTTTIISAPKEAAAKETNPELKRAAARLLAMF